MNCRFIFIQTNTSSVIRALESRCIKISLNAISNNDIKNMRVYIKNVGGNNKMNNNIKHIYLLRQWNYKLKNISFLSHKIKLNKIEKYFKNNLIKSYLK